MHIFCTSANENKYFCIMVPWYWCTLVYTHTYACEKKNFEQAFPQEEIFFMHTRTVRTY